MTVPMTTIQTTIFKIIAEHPVSKEDIQRISTSKEEKSRFVNAYIEAVSPSIQQYLDTATLGRFKARNFTSLMLNVIRYRLERLLANKE